MLFAPPQAVVYHLWSRQHRTNIPSSVSLSASDSSSPSKSTPQHDQHLNAKAKRKQRAQNKVRKLFLNNTENKKRGREAGVGVDRYGLGTIRTLAQFEAALLVSFAQQKVTFIISRVDISRPAS